MNINTKYNKTKYISQIGKYHRTFHSIWNEIPKDIIDYLPSRLLVKIINLIIDRKQYGKKIAVQEFCDVYDIKNP